MALSDASPVVRLCRDAPARVDTDLLVVPAFYRAERPVCFAEHLEFLKDLIASDADLANECLPRASDGAPLPGCPQGRPSV